MLMIKTNICISKSMLKNLMGFPYPVVKIIFVESKEYMMRNGGITNH